MSLGLANDVDTSASSTFEERLQYVHTDPHIVRLLDQMGSNKNRALTWAIGEVYYSALNERGQKFGGTYLLRRWQSVRSIEVTPYWKVTQTSLICIRRRPPRYTRNPNQRSAWHPKLI